MTVTIINRKPFSSETLKYVSNIAVSGNNLTVFGQVPEETNPFSKTYNRHEVVLNVNTREE